MDPDFGEMTGCNDYTNDAIAKNEENLRFRCGFGDQRWQSNADNHFTWCVSMRQNQAAIASERRERDRLIQECKANNCDFGDDGGLKPNGLIATTWEAIGAKKGPLGCPNTPEVDASNGGRIQTFDYGQIAWTPRTGPKSVQVAYQAGDKGIEVFWVRTEPFNYDFWIVETSTNGQRTGQTDVGGRRTDGWYVFGDALSGQTYSFAIEGCDEEGVFGAGGHATCRQGWMNPVAVTIKPNPNKKAPDFPNPPKREISCLLDLKCLKEVAETIKAVRDALKPLND